MNVFVNDKETEVKINSTINSILKDLKLSDNKGIAIAVNNHVIKKDDWDDYILNENDKVLIIRASMGG